MAALDRACRNILQWADRYARPADPTPVDWEAHHALAAEIAADCAVLMKNDGVLPLTGREKLHIAGELYANMRYQGAGSSMIQPTRVTSPKDAFEARGLRSVPPETCDVILVFAGLTDYDESEGRDRAYMRLPEDQLRLIDGLCAAGRKVVVVLFGGSPVELPFDDRVSAILYMGLPGQNGGTAVARLLFGEGNPSGRLAETWPLRYEDVPSCDTFGRTPQEVYAEGTEIGYRYYDRHGVPVRYRFGHGLSYTTFSHGAWEKNGSAYSRTVENTGDRFGGEVVQLYVDGELRGFQKVYLRPGERATVTVVAEEAPRETWSDTLSVPPPPPRLPLTMESRFTDLKQTRVGRLLFHAVLSAARVQMWRARRLPEGPARENAVKGAFFMRQALESNSPRSMSMASGGALPYNVAQGFVELANGRFMCGMRCFLRRIRVPKLPREKR